jgi:hypothetical protein
MVKSNATSFICDNKIMIYLLDEYVIVCYQIKLLFNSDPGRLDWHSQHSLGLGSQMDGAKGILMRSLSHSSLRATISAVIGS